MKASRKSLIAASIILFSSPVFAAEPPVSPMPDEFVLDTDGSSPQMIKVEKGTQILVDDYDAVARAYHFTILADQAPGPNFVTQEDLSSAIIGFSPDRIQKNPRDLVGKKFILQKEIQLATSSMLLERASGREESPDRQGNQNVFVSLDDYEALRIEKGTEVEVESYDSRSKTFTLVMTKYPDQGPNFTTLGLLGEAVKELEGKIADLAKNPESLKSKKFKLSKELKLISEDEVEKRLSEFSKREGPNTFFQKTPASSEKK